MDPRFGPAWIAFGHTFAIEGEHDHAITAYSTSARLFQGYVLRSCSSMMVIKVRQVTPPPSLCRHGASMS